MIASMIRGNSALFAAALGAVATASGTAQAQESPPFDPAIDVQLFEYAIGPKTFFSIADASIAGKGQLAVDAFVTFLTNPFTVYNVDPEQDVIEGTRTKVVESVLAGDLSAAYGVSERFQVGLDLPIIFQASGEGLMPDTAGPDPMGLRVSGTGDLRGEIKARLWRNPRLAVAGALGLTLPTSFGSGGAKFIGDDLPTVRGRVMGQWSAPGDRFTVGANLGLLFRKPRTIYASTVGQQLTWGLAGSFRPTERFALIAELFGRTGLGSFDLDASPMELEGGFRIQATRAVSVMAGGGGGVVHGIGSPDVRIFASVGWAPDTRDSDGDGVANNRDDCANVAEDRDGFKDDDGCPENDNDGDRREDAVDKCPDQPEDFDGWDDDDGCPELDNDGDGYADLDDTCPLDREDGRDPFPKDGCPGDKRDVDQDGLSDVNDKCVSDAEDPDGFEDWDGCPDEDQDHDGVADDVDQCPVCPEDADGFGDEDGCPEADNDSDGIPDAGDTCPVEPEVVNGIDDLDGCADEGGALLVQYTDDKKLTLIRIPTFDARGLNTGGRIITDQIGLTMMQHPEVTRWTLAVAAKTDVEAQQQAAWIKARLVERGLVADTIDVVTSAGLPQIGVIIGERYDGPPVAVCPAGKQVLPRPAPPTAAQTPVVPPTTGTPPIAPTTGTPPSTGTPPITGTPPVTGTPPITTPPPTTPPITGTPPATGAALPAVFAAWQGVQTRIAFERDSMKLAKGANKALDELAVLLKGNPAVIVTIAVHTDTRRPAAEAQVITDNQAETARAYLLGRGVRAEQIEAAGKGSAAPLAGVTGDKHRRVELSFH